ncbi:TolC family protein [Helicobacter sp. faydin-H20]|uniref:TolC family protein n=1 Tax=Helicobacter anatolicus TaxID=2905874 RepID=UPI001E5762FE|nr:TolC family protein [Helicobacter anatolicus]MCE3036944.1 TolC family protein [Helicobacter anatolicus]
MKNFVFVLFFCFVNALSLDEAVMIALQKSDFIATQESLKKQGEYLKKAKYSALMPTFDGGYSFSYNIPGRSSDYYLNAFHLKFSYNLFNGLKDYYAIKDSKEEVKRLDYALSDSVFNVVLKTKSAYIHALQSKILLEILKTRKKNLEIQRTKAQQFVFQGIRAKNESLSMDILLSNTLISIKNAELSIDYQLKTLEQLLKTPVHLEELKDIEIDTEIVLNEEEIFSQVLERNTQYLNLLSLLDSAKLQHKISYSNFLPKLDLSGIKYWYVDGGSSIVSTSYGLQSQLRLNLSWNFFNGLSDGYKYQASRVYILSLQNKVEALKRELKIKLQEYFKRLNLSKEQYAINKDSLNKAEENYKITNNRYVQGIGTYTELIDAELLLNTARTNIAQAKYDIALILAELDYFICRP